MSKKVRGSRGRAIDSLTDEQSSLAAANAFLVPWAVKRLMRRYDSMHVDDIYSACNEGLVLAARTYDPAKGKFSTHAWRRMWAVCLRDLTCNSAPMRRPAWTVGPSRRHRDRQSSEHCIAAAKATSAMQRTPLDQLPVSSTACYQQCDQHTVDETDYCDAVLGVLASRNRRWVDIIRRVVMNKEMTMIEYGRRHGIPSQQASDQIKQRAIRGLRAAAATLKEV